MSEQPLAVLERLAEIERDHGPMQFGSGIVRCRVCADPQPCDAIQLTQAVRAQQTEIETGNHNLLAAHLLIQRYREALEKIAQPDGKGHPTGCWMRSTGDPCRCDEEIAQNALGVAAPSREGT